VLIAPTNPPAERTMANARARRKSNTEPPQNPVGNETAEQRFDPAHIKKSDSREQASGRHHRSNAEPAQRPPREGSDGGCQKDSQGANRADFGVGPAELIDQIGQKNRPSVSGGRDPEPVTDERETHHDPTIKDGFSVGHGNSVAACETPRAETPDGIESEFDYTPCGAIRHRFVMRA